ncbi:hypothetical protein [Spongiimicrobium sp. 3-5]|uniref:hypothetical protein n=1 Tax=Spongiimicrobium sp. 3-5 TaxID=3332596 RepID=UPI003980056F
MLETLYGKMPWVQSFGTVAQGDLKDTRKRLRFTTSGISVPPYSKIQEHSGLPMRSMGKPIANFPFGQDHGVRPSETNDMRLGEMNKLLHEKIEELIFYILKQQMEPQMQKESNLELEQD